MAKFLLVPIKLLAKALLYLLAAVLGAVGFISLIASVILIRLGFIGGGLAIITAIAMRIFVADTESLALYVGLMGVGAIILPVIMEFISNGIIMLKEKLLDVSADIELI